MQCDGCLSLVCSVCVCSHSYLSCLSMAPGETQIEMLSDRIEGRKAAKTVVTFKVLEHFLDSCEDVSNEHNQGGDRITLRQLERMLIAAKQPRMNSLQSSTRNLLNNNNKMRKHTTTMSLAYNNRRPR